MIYLYNSTAYILRQNHILQTFNILIMKLLRGISIISVVIVGAVVLYFKDDIMDFLSKNASGVYSFFNKQ